MQASSPAWKAVGPFDNVQVTSPNLIFMPASPYHVALDRKLNRNSWRLQIIQHRCSQNQCLGTPYSKTIVDWFWSKWKAVSRCSERPKDRNCTRNYIVSQTIYSSLTCLSDGLGALQVTEREQFVHNNFRNGQARCQPRGFNPKHI